MSAGAFSFFVSEGYDVQHTSEGICAQSDLDPIYAVKHYAGGVNSEFSNFGLSQTQMGILINKLVDWVYLIRAKAQIGSNSYVKMCYLGTQISRRITYRCCWHRWISSARVIQYNPAQLYTNNCILIGPKRVVSFHT